MASPDTFLSASTLIPGLGSPSSSNRSPLPSSPPSPGITGVSRSKTAPPPLASLQAIASVPEGSEPLLGSPGDDAILPAPVVTRDALGLSNTTPAIPPSVMRRTSSTLSTGSAHGGREKKRLRFTPLVPSDATFEDVEAGYGESSTGKHGVPRDQEYLKSDPGTPNLLETADQIRRTLSLASLDSLLVLSANQAGERRKLLRQVSKAGKELVWRDEKEKKVFPRDTERAGVLAAKRGLRSFALGFSVRAGVNILLMLFRSFRRRKIRLAMVLHAIFGQEPFRFGAMIGTFTFLNTLTLHILRLAPPMSYLRRRFKAGLFVQPTFGPPEREGDEGERRWQAAVAGAVGSLALLWESKSRRTGVAQQMFVRGLQGAYNQYTPRYGIHIPHGDLLLFGLCCGQIMFAFLLSPETMPREYVSWIQSASRVPQFAVAANRTAFRQDTVEPLQLERALKYYNVTPHARSVLETWYERIKVGWRPDHHVPCEMVHPWCDSCYETNIRRFFAVFRFMLPVYGALHLIPMLVLRRHHFKRAPLRMLARVLWGITRSCSFLGGFVVIFQALFCLRVQTMERLRGQESLLKTVLRRKETMWAVGFSTCLALFFEEKKRRAELAMYVLPRALESAWSSARRRAWVPIVPFGETILGAAAMAMVMDSYKHSPEALSGIVRRLLFQLVGPV